MGRRKVGIRDVAAEAGVSMTTVSHILNNVAGARVNGETRERVLEVAQRLGYAPNGLARGLRMRRSGLIGLIGDEIATTPYAGKIVLGAQQVVQRHGGILVVTDAGGDPDVEEQAALQLLSRQVEGVLFAAMYHRNVTVPASLEGAPVVLLDAICDDPAYSSVVPDEVAGGRAAARVLLDAGHRRLGFINDVEDIPARHGRRIGFLDEARRAGGVSVAETECEPWAHTGRIAALEMLRSPDRPTGVFAFNDRIAMGVYQAAAENALRIPDDLSVVGFDDMEVISQGLRPALTTVALPHLEMGAWAAEQLFRLIEGASSPPPTRHQLQGSVIHRFSVAPPPRT
ncbi:LacI family DNA-binding transcriptional regulator [Actinocorallia lasiicapitis]